MHGWIVIGGSDGFKDAKPENVPADMKYYYLDK
jgi:hypothetical protein